MTSSARAHASAAVAVLARDTRLALSYRSSIVAQLLGVVFSLTLFYYLSRLVRVEAFDSSDTYYAFVVVGLVILQVLNATLQTPPSALRQEVVAGTFERAAISPFGPVGTLLATLLYPLANALATGVVMLGVAWALFDLPVRWSTAALGVPVAALAAAAFVPFGAALMAVVLVVKQAIFGPTWIVAGISLLAGLYFPVELLPDWIEWATEVQPFTPAVDLMRNALVGTPRTDPLWLDVGRLVASAAVLFPLAIVALRLALRHSRRRGTILEY